MSTATRIEAGFAKRAGLTFSSVDALRPRFASPNLRRAICRNYIGVTLMTDICKKEPSMGLAAGEMGGRT